MKTKVYTSALTGPDNTLLWEGDLQHKYSKGDVIFIGDGWGGCDVSYAYYELNGESQELFVDDGTNEMREHVEKYGLFNVTKGNT